MSKTILDIIEEKFEKPKSLLIEELDKHLTLFDLNDEYKNEIENSFNSNTKLIFDMEKSGKTFLDFVTKVYGKEKIVSYHYIEFEKFDEQEKYSEDSEDGEEAKEITSRQLIYLNGRLDLLNKIFNFKKNDLFTYGNYEDMRRTDYCFTSFRAQNSDILIKVEEDCAYGIFTSHGYVDVVLKIKKDFFENPVIEMSEGLRLEDRDAITEENVGKIFNTLRVKKGFLKEFKIFQIEN